MSNRPDGGSLEADGIFLRFDGKARAESKSINFRETWKPQETEMAYKTEKKKKKIKKILSSLGGFK